jgi:hypothetical protein
MRKLIICDKNKELIKAVNAFIKDYGFGVFDSVEVICGDVVKVHEKYPETRIVTASNPDFSPDGGLDAILAKKYDWNPSEFTWNDDLFFVKSVDSERKSSKEILLRAAVGILGYSTKFVPILTGIGTGIGGVAVEVFIDILRAVLSNLRSADLSFANLSSADLRSANLRSANLSSADLSSADLRSADLSFANLSSADLSFANLRSAKNLSYKYHDSLNLLRFQKGKLVAYKYVNSDMKSPQNGSLHYEVGKTIKEDDYQTDDTILCDKGLNVASLEWCLREGSFGSPIIEVEFKASDIVSIPYNTDGKFRVKKLKVVRLLSEKEIIKMLKKTRSYEVKEL